MAATLSGELPGRSHAAPLEGVGVWRRLRAAVARTLRAVRRQPRHVLLVWSRVPFERLFWIGFVALLLLFVLLLVVQPTGAGRGGR